MPNLATDLARVMELLEKATPGPWSMCPDGHEFVITSDVCPYVATIHSGKHDTTKANAQLIVAALSFLRQHGPEIAETFKETPNG